MKQFLLKTWLTMLCLLVFGGGSAWAEEVMATLTGTNLLEGDSPSTSYADHNTGITDDKGNVYKGRWLYQKNGSDYLQMIQLKKRESSSSSRIALPTFPGNIKTIKLSVTDASAATSDGDGCKASFSIGKKYYNSGDYTTNQIAKVGANSNGAKSVVFDLTNLTNKTNGTDLYITIGDYSARIWSIVVVYEIGDAPLNPTALSVPSNLSSSNVTTTGATLSWDAVSNASSYTVKIGETEYTGVNTNSYSATGLTAGTQYTWTVKAVGDGTNYSTSDYAANVNFTTEAEQGEEPSGDELTVDFESDASAYTDWTFTNIITKNTNSNVPAHGGSYFGTTGGKESGSVQTKDKVNPGTITFYISKQTTNTTSSSWIIQTSTNGTSWSDAKTVSASSVTRGEWTEVTHTFSDVSNVYVRVYYTGTTAVRCIDDLTLTLADESEPEPEPTSYTITWSVNGKVVKTEELQEGNAVSAPTVSAINNKAFMGWVTTSTVDSETKPTYVTPTTATADATYYAVFATKNDVDGEGERWTVVSDRAAMETGVYAMISPDGHAFNGSFTDGGHGNQTAETFTFTDGVATSAPEGTCELTITAIESNKYTIYSDADGKYLYISAATSGNLGFKDAPENNYWNFAKNSNQSEGAEQWLYHYSNTAQLRYYNNTFRNYQTSGTNGDVVMFAKKEGESTYSDFTTAPLGIAKISIGQYEYATLVAPCNLDLEGTGVTAYAITSTDLGNSVVRTTEVTKVPAGKPIIVHGAQGDYNIHGIAEADDFETMLEASESVVVYGEDTANDYYYLGVNGDKVCFKKLTSGSLAAGKCFFKIAKGSEVKVFSMIFNDDDATGISSVENVKMNNGAVYNLAGQRVNANAKGIVIVNGKKMLNK